MGLFDLQPTVTLFDLTNTFFEGAASRQPKAQRGHSKDKRSDCRLLTLGLVLDGAGFVRRSKVFAGRVDEHRTLAGMLEALAAPRGALVVMRGVATEDRIQWLRQEGYVPGGQPPRRPAVRPRGGRDGGDRFQSHLTAPGSPNGQEVRLYCCSQQRAQKERGIVERFSRRFERGSADSPRGCHGRGLTKASRRSGRGSGG